MIQNFRVKNSKDIETAQESLLQGIAFTNKCSNKINPNLTNSITSQQFLSDNFDNFIEKKE